MPERLPKTDEYWKAQQLVIGRVGNAALKDYDKADIELPAISDKYERLAFSFYDAFRHRIWVTDISHVDSQVVNVRNKVASVLEDSAAVWNGYKVMGRLLSYGVRAYNAYVKEHTVEPTVESAVDVLKHSQTQRRLLSWFANTTNEVNIIREENFGLHDQPFAHNSTVGDNPFVCHEDSKTGEIYIGYDEAIYAQATSEVLKIKAIMPSSSRPSGCPAHDVLLGNLWEAMVDAAASDPELLPADLAAVQI